MPREYVKQHTIPQCYLRNFVAPSGISLASGKKVRENAVLCNKRDLSECWWSKSISSLFVKKRFYNLAEWGGSDPQIEKLLSKVEQDYSRVFQRIENHEELTHGDLNSLSLFITTLSFRTQKGQRNSESFVRSIFSVPESQEEDDYYLPSMRGSTERMIKNLPKQSMFNWKIAEFLEQQGFHYFENKTPHPFISSDHPVSHDSQTTIAQLEESLGSSDCLSQLIQRDEPKPFTMLPLSPTLVLVSSALIGTNYTTCPYIPIHHRKAVEEINGRTWSVADEIIISCKEHSLGEFACLSKSAPQEGSS